MFVRHCIVELSLSRTATSNGSIAERGDGLAEAGNGSKEVCGLPDEQLLDRLSREERNCEQYADAVVRVLVMRRMVKLNTALPASESSLWSCNLGIPSALSPASRAQSMKPLLPASFYLPPVVGSVGLRQKLLQLRE